MFHVMQLVSCGLWCATLWGANTCTGDPLEVCMLEVCRYMRQQFKIQVARRALRVEDSYVKWNEGPTSMDSSMEPEALVLRTPDQSGDRRAIPPPGKVFFCPQVVLLQ